ncbi:MAG: ATPase [Bacteroidales bacterium]|nr:ATPase [Bacteroidales bacterium]
MKKVIAIPASRDYLSQHFGHCEQFAVFQAEGEEITEESYLTPPRHEPGILPVWLASRGVTHVIAGGMGHRAISLFNQQNIQVHTGAEEKHVRVLAEEFIKNNLKTGINTCDH